MGPSIGRFLQGSPRGFVHVCAFGKRGFGEHSILQRSFVCSQVSAGLAWYDQKFRV